MNVRTYLALEIALTRRLSASWRAVSHPIYSKLAQAVSEERWNDALALVPDLDMTHVGQENREYIRHMLLSCAMYGAARANTGATFMSAGSHTTRVNHVTSTICQYFEHRATNLIQAKALQLIAQAEQAAKTKQIASVHKEEPEAEKLPLYVMRPLLNADELVAWAKEQGFTTCLLPEDMHCTICYSKAPMDWAAAGDSIDYYQNDSGPRKIEQFNKGAAVLVFPSVELKNRHQQFIDNGASYDFPEYLSHVTLSYSVPEGLDITKITPYDGVLKFGPEVFEEVNADKEKLEKVDRYSDEDRQAEIQSLRERIHALKTVRSWLE